MTGDEILKLDDLQREAVTVPEWGCDVLLRTMTAAERDAFESETYSTNGESVEINRTNLRARLVAATAINADGTKLFPNGSVERLGGKSAVALDRLYTAASRLNRLTAGDVDVLEKNSDSGPVASS